MCGRYTLVSKLKRIEKRFDVIAPEKVVADFEPNTNISHGDRSLVITDKAPRELGLFQFGFTPRWAKKQAYVINARAEGDANKDNDPLYDGPKDIVSKPMFRQSIRDRRCLILADCFFEGPEREKLSRPYLVYLRDGQRPFAFAGIWDEWVDTATGEVIQSFAIITTVSNAVTKAIGHHRSPVILAYEQERRWLDPRLPMPQLIDMLEPYPADLMNAYPVDAQIRSPTANGLHLLEPTGGVLFEE